MVQSTPSPLLVAAGIWRALRTTLFLILFVACLFFPFLPGNAVYRPVDDGPQRRAANLHYESGFFSPKFKVVNGRLYLLTERTYSAIILVTSYQSIDWAPESLDRLPVDPALWPSPNEPGKGIQWLAGADSD